MHAVQRGRSIAPRPGREKARPELAPCIVNFAVPELTFAPAKAMTERRCKGVIKGVSPQAPARLAGGSRGGCGELGLAFPIGRAGELGSLESARPGWGLFILRPPHGDQLPILVREGRWILDSASCVTTGISRQAPHSAREGTGEVVARGQARHGCEVEAM